MEISAKAKVRAPKNRTITLDSGQRSRLNSQIRKTVPPTRLAEPVTGIVLGSWCDWVKVLPLGQVDLLFLDPPYNLNKSFNGKKFNRLRIDEYTAWLDDILSRLKPLLKPAATIYICGDWLTSVSIFEAASKHFVVRSRITWEREKGRGAKTNWKNSCEDIWFCTMTDEYTFNVEDVKLRRRVLAPYSDSNGSPKDWKRSESGDFRDTYPSNIWTDITIPFWSMPENTDHPTQKSEKLLAKLILASSNVGDLVFDPFLGSGTTAVAAKKLDRRCLGIEIDEEYCALAARRLELAESNSQIQGLCDGVFWERNSLQKQKLTRKKAVRKKGNSV